MSFEGYNKATLRQPLRGPFGELLFGEIGKLQDDELALLRVAMISRLPSRCPDDALAAVGRWFQIDRYEADTDDTYRARIEAAWPTWDEAGAATSIEGQIQAFGIPDVFVVPACDGQFAPDPNANYAEFWIFLGPDYGTVGIAPLELGSWTLGGEETLGSTATHAQIVAIKRIILKWKAAHSYPVRIYLLFGAGPVLGVGVAGGSKPLTLGSFTLGGVTAISWPIGRTLNDTLPTLGSSTFILGGFEI